ncbi:hypothetical protein SLH49_02605 [Cognatiyoonia sp. IB215446]|uniref:hypothetical protein n=1 Tax=Cognatiyoonia sp. IB215446 TaxID=3097355 RepID=UPI002A11EABF|nr:hypothetical protein [Cognatiyoonia sp. IB215446]MDX8346867.1 hypothetical protein [Cognatiyoonia sp. IB215446]
MPCFCTVPTEIVSNRFSPSMSLVLPPVPLSLQAAVAFPNLTPENRLDMQIAALIDPIKIPNIHFGGGGLAQIAMTISMMMGNFTFDDLPKLEFQMQQAATSINTNVWPRLKGLVGLRMQPLLNYSIIARLVIDLQSLGIDPFNITFFPEPPVNLPHRFRFALKPPQIKKARFLAGLPQLFQMTEALDLPPLGDPGVVSAMQNRFNMMARLSPPQLIVPMPMLMKLMMVLEALATIEAAFGDDAFTPAGMMRTRSMLRLWGGFPIPMPPMPALAMNMRLAALPPLEDIQLGEQMLGSMSNPSFRMASSPPKLAIMPFLNVAMALNTAMTMTLDMPPFDMCSLCPCA